MRIAAGVEYDGTDFCGWQSQDEGRTVQGEVEKALSFVANEPVSVSCAGRTDTGVHAIGQVIHFDTEVQRSDRSWLLGCNSNLPADINIGWVQPVSDDFHARFSAVSRSYRYVIMNRPTRSAIHQHRVNWQHQSLDVTRMQAAALFFLGEHDFTSFRALACQAKSPVRTIHSLDIKRQGDYIIIDLNANAFLHHMVRNIVGSLLAIAEGRKNPDWITVLLAAKDRSVAAATSAAHGLYLTSVKYPEQFSLPASPAAPIFS